MTDDYRLSADERTQIREQLAPFTLEHKQGRLVTEHDTIRGVRQAAVAVPGDATQDALGLPCGDAVSAADVIAALRLVPGERRDLDFAEAALIEAARDRGETWESLGAALGTRSGQAMQQRYKRLGGTRTWPTRRPGAAG
jgi:hypothetical protein